MCTSAHAQTPFQHQGLDLLHPPDSAVPNEQVDPASGTLTVIATDLVLPGNAGLNLAITRVYNSSIYPNYNAGDLSLEERSWAGVGWRLHFGRVLHTDTPVGGQMQVEMGDGSRHPLYHSIANSNIWTTTDFWLYNPATNVLQLPNGNVYTFGHQVPNTGQLGTVAYVTDIHDPFGNDISFSYFNGVSGPADGVQYITQTLSSTETRLITFGVDSNNALHTMSYLNHTWTYTQTANGPSGYPLLGAVQPPLGPPTTYQYGGASALNGEMSGIVAPFGGTLTYTYQDATRIASTLSVKTRVVATRTTGGRAIPTATTWTFSYGAGSNQDTTIVSCPCGTNGATATTSYRFDGTGLSADFTGWKAGTLLERIVTDGATTLEDHTMHWTQSEAISNDPVSGTNGVWSDTAVHRPLLDTHTTSRNGNVWMTTFGYHTGQGNFNDYGNPYDILAQESASPSPYFYRHTQRTFQHLVGPQIYILARVATETVTQNSAYNQADGSTSSSWNYLSTTGFLQSQNIHGFATTFEPRSDGNVNAATDGLGNRTTFSYDWGVVSAVATPKLTTTYVVSPEGLISSATTGTLTTSYGYDTALRLRSVTPPSANPILYDPDDLHGSYVTMSRGHAQGMGWTEHDVDGFGREIKVFDSQGLQTWIERDAYGRPTRAADPFTSGPWTATTFSYDALGRTTSVAQRTTSNNPTGDVTTYAYNGVVQTRTDANGHTTSYQYRAFGDPSNTILWSVTDAAQNTTSYLYDVSGALRSVSQPGAPGVTISRTWNIGSGGLVLSDTQPESGTTTQTYDAVGNLKTITDANGAVTTLTYDANNRLFQRTSTPDATDNLTITYNDSANGDGTGRIQALTGSATTTTYTYDDVHRKVTRTDQTAVGTFTSSETTDVDGNLFQVVYPSSRLVQYTYDAEDNLTSVQHQPPGAQSLSNFATSFTPADNGQLGSFVTGAVTHQFTYTANRLTHLLTSGGSQSLDLTYSYDNAGNITQIADPRPNATQIFVPDPLDRLTQATGPWGTLNWSYDAAGNRRTESNGSTTTTYTYDAPTQRLTSTSGGGNETFTYNNVGQLTSDAVVSQYTYSPVGHLKFATVSGVTWNYAYDALGERLTKSANNQTIYTVRGPDGQTLSEYLNSCGAQIWTRDLVYAGGQLIGAAKTVSTQPTLSMTTAATTVSEGPNTVSGSVVLTTPNGGPLGCAASVVVSTANGTGIAGTNYTGSSQTLTFAPGSANGASQPFTVSILDDHLFNGNQTFSVSLSQPLGAALGATPTESVTITEADLPTIEFVASATSVNENAGTLNLALSLGRTTIALPSSISAQYTFTDGTAVNGRNYRGSAGTVSFPAGSTPGATQTIPITIIDDDYAYDGNLTFSVTLATPSGATLAAPTTETVTSIETDPAPAPVVVVEAPGQGTVWGSNVAVSGYAYDQHAMNGGTGVSAVNVYAYPNADLSQNPVFLGTASYGNSRSDVCSGQYVHCGFSMTAVLPYTGAWLVRAFAQDPLGGTFYPSNTTTFTVQPTPRMNVDTPVAGNVASYFWVSGWAIDAGSGSGPGVDVVNIYAYPNPGSGQPAIFLGTATYGGSRPDIGAVFGSQFTPSGFGLYANLGAGYYEIVVYAHSTVTASWSQAETVYVTVSAGIVMSVDTPANNATVSQTFAISGWAVDTTSSSGDGVPFLDIWAFPANGNPAIFLGQPSTIAGSRPDVGAYFQSSRFSDSGWGVTPTLSPGGYWIACYPYSSMTNSFGTATVVYVTVQ